MFDGSLTLQGQTESKTTVLATIGSSATLDFSNALNGKFSTEIQPFAEFFQKQPDWKAFHDWLDENKIPQWTHSVLGSLAIFSTTFGWLPKQGISFAISSDIPMDLGTSSSVSFEIATLRSLEKLSGFYFENNDLATASQKVETEILSRWCPIDNPLAAAFGKPGSILPIENKTAKLRTAIELPKGIVLAACLLDQTNTQLYNVANTASAMGVRIAKEHFDHKNEYTANLNPSSYSRNIAKRLPEELSGLDFEKSYGPTIDEQFEIHPDTAYPIQAATQFTIDENYRCKMAAHMLSNMIHNAKRKSVEIVGELMLQSYFQSRSLNLTNLQSDEALDMLSNLGPQNGVYGARLNFGLKQSSLVVLVERSALRQVRNSLDRINAAEPISVIQ